MSWEGKFEFNDSIAAHAVPMINVTCLSSIFVPPDMLRNKGTIIDTNLNQRSIFHTLKKHVITDCFSRLSRSNIQSNKLDDCSLGDSSSESFSEADLLDVLNDCSKISPTGSINKNEDFEQYSGSLVSCNELVDSFYLQSSIDDSLWINSHEELFVAKENGSIEKNTEQYNPYNTNHFANVDTILGSLKGSLEEIYCSRDEDLYQDGSSTNQIETCNQTDVYPISDDCLNILSHSEEIGIESLNNKGKSERKQLGVPECNTSTAVVEPSDCLKNSELDSFIDQELDLRINEKQTSSNESLVEYPIAYQKPTIEVSASKHKKQKDKKKKNTPKQLYPVKVVSSGKAHNTFDFQEPLKDEFYEHVMRKKCHKPYALEYPALSEESQISSDHFELINPVEIQTPEISFKDFKSVDINKTGDHTVSTKSNELERKEEEIAPELKEVQNIGTIVIENIPLDVTEEQLQSIVLGYGELKQFSLQPCGEFQKSIVKMDFTYDIDWIVECLSGNQPFGTSTETLNCYKLC